MNFDCIDFCSPFLFLDFFESAMEVCKLIILDFTALYGNLKDNDLCQFL